MAKTKKPLKMKRVDDKSLAEDAIKETKITDDPKPMKLGNGAVVSLGSDTINTPEEAPVSSETATVPSNEGGIVTAGAPEMKEISYEEFAASRKSTLADGADSTATVKALEGVHRDEAEKVLRKLQDNGHVTGFRMVSMGQAMTEDFVAGRVQCLLDLQGNVISVEIS